MFNDLDHALVPYQASLDPVRLSATHLTTARKQLDSQAASFTAGNADRLALTQAKADYQANEIVHLDAVIAAQQAAGRLEDAMHRPLAPEPANPIVTQDEISR